MPTLQPVVCEPVGSLASAVPLAARLRWCGQPSSTSALPPAVDLEPFVFAVSDRLIELLTDGCKGRALTVDLAQTHAARA